MTASAVKSVPSWNFTPRRRWKIQVFLSSLSCSQRSARPGRKPASLSERERSHSTRPSKIG